MNLATDVQITPDYSLSTADVFCSVAAHYITSLDYPLDILCTCGTDKTDLVLEDGFPSWVPQWRNHLPSEVFRKEFEGETQVPTRCYGASGQTILPIGHLYRPLVEGLVLRLYGLEVDKTATTTVPIRQSNFREVEKVLGYSNGSLQSRHSHT